MTTAPSTAMSKAEYLALAEQKYTDLQALATQPTFYDYEKSFEAIWMDLGGCNSNCRYSPLVKGAGFRLLSAQAPAVAHSALRTGLAMRQFELHPNELLRQARFRVVNECFKADEATAARHYFIRGSRRPKKLSENQES